VFRLIGFALELVAIAAIVYIAAHELGIGFAPILGALRSLLP